MPNLWQPQVRPSFSAFSHPNDCQVQLYRSHGQCNMMYCIVVYTEPGVGVNLYGNLLRFPYSVVAGRGP